MDNIKIPEGAELLKTGLYVYRYTKTIRDETYTFGQLYSSEGYCFYDNSLPEEERIYMQFQTLTITEAAMTNDELKTLVTSIPVGSKTDDEATEEDYIAALAELGVDV